jgi:hypothetical protein
VLAAAFAAAEFAMAFAAAAAVAVGDSNKPTRWCDAPLTLQAAQR